MNSKHKGSAFERKICKALSLWISDGQRQDVFWRSAMSGGRATVRGLDVRQAGDVCAVAPEGHAFCNQFYVELKHLKSLDFHCLLKGTGMLHKHFATAAKQALKRGQTPLLIARQNGTPIIVATYEYANLTPRLTMTQGGDEFYVYRFADYIGRRWRRRRRNAHHDSMGASA